MRVLRDAIDLERKGRHNAAKATWKTLPKDFRNKICDLCMAVIEHGEDFQYQSVSFESPFGAFKLVKNGPKDELTLSFDDLAEIVPVLTG